MPLPPVVIGVVAEKVLTWVWGLFTKKTKKKKTKIEKHKEKVKSLSSQVND